MVNLNILLLVAGAYLAGSIPFGFVIGKAKGVDIRKLGSGNIGTSNVKRILGGKAAIATLLGDGLKGLLPVLVARIWFGDQMWVLVATGLAAIIGHNWPIWLGFKGGKGVTTTYGAFLGIAWLPALLTIVTWTIVSKITHKASLAALISSPGVLLFTLLLHLVRPVPALLPHIIFGVAAMGMIYLRHLDNIKRLAAGTELRQDDKIAASTDDHEA